MAILYQKNFDTDSTGALTGWVNGTGSAFVVGTTNPITGAHSFGEAVFADGHTAVYTGISSQADQCAQVSQICNVVGGGGAATGISLRTDSAGTTTGYYFLPDFVQSQVFIFKRTSGSFSLLDNVATVPTFSNGDVGFLKVECSGTTIRWKCWKGGTVEPASWTRSITDSSISTAGYMGLRTGAEGDGTAHGTTAWIDDLFIGDVGQSFIFTVSPTAIGTGTTGNAIALTGTDAAWTVGSPGSPTFTLATTGSGASIASQSVGGTNAATLTVTAGTSGTITITDPATKQATTITVASTSAILPNSAGLFFSPYNWLANGSTNAIAVNPGAYFKTKFTGTSCIVGVDVSQLSGNSITAKKYPRVRYRIDGGSWTTYQLLSTDTAVTVATGLTSGSHLLEFWLQASDSLTDRWNTPVSAAIVTGFTVDFGGTVTQPSLKSKRAIWFGDSITEGAWVDGDHSDLTNYSNFEEHLSSYTKIISDYIGAEYGACAFGSQGWEHVADGNPPNVQTSYSSIYSGHSRLSGGLFTPAPDFLFVNLGTNDSGSLDATITSDVTTMMGTFRTAAGASCKIVVIVPFNHTKQSAVTTGYNNYVSANPSDLQVQLIDLGAAGVTASTSTSNPADSFDGLHPNTAGHLALAALMEPSLPAAPSTGGTGNNAIGIAAGYIGI